jgi:hypothetical protein
LVEETANYPAPMRTELGALGKARRMPSLFRRAATLVTASGLAVVGAQLIAVTAASAHYNTVSGVAHCQQDGSYTVTWTVVNSYPTEDETATVKAHAPDSAVTPTSFDLAKSGTSGDSATVTQSGVAGSATTATLSVTGLWHPDNFTEDADGAVTLAGTCAAPAHRPAAPSAQNGACIHNTIVAPSVSIPSDSGVTYSLDRKTVAPGSHDVTAGRHTVTAASTGVPLVGTTRWTFHLHVAPGSCGAKTTTPATPVVSQSRCSGGTPTSPTLVVHSTPQIGYTVSRSGPYRAGQRVRVIATTHAGYVFGSLPQGWTKRSATRAATTVTFSASPTCSGAANEGAHHHPAHTTGYTGGLANTGSRTGELLTGGIALILVGLGCLLLAGRRRGYSA